MTKLLIRIPTNNDRDRVWAYRSEFLSESTHIPGSGNLGKLGSYPEWIEHLKVMEMGDPDRGFVKATQFICLNDKNHLVGVIQLRHALNEYLENYGGHIGYSVAPSQRQKGYATEMLKLCLGEAQKVGLKRALITCDDDNVVSAKVIQANGGIYEDTRIDTESNAVKRFWVDLS